jgi:Na+-translocating ferredoxin:NAD+ oxidoreductase subunit B
MEAILTAMIMMLAVGGFLGALLGVAGVLFYVKPDERVEKVLAMLPGYNCGACGYPGCAGLADALVEGKVTKVSACKPSSAQQRVDIANYLIETPGPDGKTLTVVPK